jgi:Mg-chelatase subunit ChlD
LIEGDMQRRFCSVGISGFLLCLVKWMLVASLTVVPLAEASDIQVSADGSYAASTQDIASKSGPKDALSTILPTTQNPAASTTPKDLIFVIDNSGSMKKNDPDFTTKRAVTHFLDQLQAQDRCGIVLFDSQANLITPLLEVATGESMLRLKGSLEKVNYRGQRTNSPAGIERAIYELRTYGRDNASKSIIFLTDGIVDTGSAQSDAEKTRWLREDLTAESRKSGIRIFGVAFTEHADFQLIQSLAMKTEGTYYRALDAAGMEAAFTSIADQIVAIDAAKAAEQAAQKRASMEAAAEATMQQRESRKPEETLPPTTAGSEGATAEQANQNIADKTAGAVALRGMWKIYLPLFIIALLLISVLFYMVLKLRGARGPLTSRILEFLPGAKEGDEPAVKVPEAQLIDLGQASSGGEGPLLIEKMQTTIGRDPRNDVVINQATISGFHACITFERDCFEIEDYRSTNGSFVNGIRLEADVPRHLKTGDTIKFADFDFRFMRLDRIPDDQTVMLSSMSLPAESFSQPPPENPLPAEEMGSHFSTVLNRQLEQVAGMGAPFAKFVEDYLDPFTQNLLAAKVSNHLDDDATGAFFASDVLHRPPIAYKLCQLPVPPQQAAAWFEEAHGGFLSFLETVLDKEVQQQPGCDTLCMISYGWKETPWISLSIVPAGEGDHPVEIMSVEFLTPREVDMLGLVFDEQGRILSSIHTGLVAKAD